MGVAAAALSRDGRSDDAVGPQAVDVGRAVAELGQDVLGVLARRRGRRPCAGRCRPGRPGGSSAGTAAPPGIRTSRQRSRALSTGWSRNSSTSLTPALAMPCVVQQLHRLAAVASSANRSATIALSSSRWATRSEPVAKRGSSIEPGRPEELLAQGRPFALVLDGEQHVLAVGRGVGAVRGDGRVLGADARGLGAAVAGVVGGLAHPLGQRLEQRDLHGTGHAGGRPREQGGEDAASRRTCRPRCRRPRLPTRAELVVRCRSARPVRSGTAPAGRTPCGPPTARWCRSRRWSTGSATGSARRARRRPGPSGRPRPGRGSARTHRPRSRSCSRTSRPRSDFRSSVRDSFDRLSQTK